MHHLPTHTDKPKDTITSHDQPSNHNEYIPWIWVWWFWQQQFPIWSPALVPEQLLGHSPGDSAIRKCPPIYLCYLRPHWFDPGQPDSPADTRSCCLHWRWVVVIETILKGVDLVMWRNSLQQGCLSINKVRVGSYLFTHSFIITITIVVSPH